MPGFARSWGEAARDQEAVPSRREPDRLARALYRRWRRALASDLEADCIQAARLAAWRARGRLAALPVGAATAYLSACVRRAVWHVIRTELRHNELVRACHVEACHSQPGAPSGCEVAASVGERLAALPRADQQVLYLALERELPDAEIARELGLSPAAAAKRRQRALARLRRLLDCPDGA